MYNALNGSQSNASAFKFIGLVQPLKHSKQFVYILHIKTPSIVPNEYYQLISVSVGASDLDFGLWARARKFDRIGKKVHEYKPQHRAVPVNIGQCADFPGNVAPLCVFPNFAQSFVYQLWQVNQGLLRFSPPDSRKSQEIVNQIAH